MTIKKQIPPFQNSFTNLQCDFRMTSLASVKSFIITFEILIVYTYHLKFLPPSFP